LKNVEFKTICAAALVASCLLVETVHAAGIVWQDAAGNPVTAPTALDPSQNPIYFTENVIPGGGYYDVTNNTASYRLFAFGISNVGGSLAWMGDGPADFGDDFDCGGSLGCYESLNLAADNWGLVEIDFDANTGAEIFGDITNVLDAGETALNFYRAGDGDLGPGQAWDNFLWQFTPPASQMFVVLDGSDGYIYGSGILPSAIPLPAGVWLLGSGIAALMLRRRVA